MEINQRVIVKGKKGVLIWKDNPWIDANGDPADILVKVKTGDTTDFYRLSELSNDSSEIIETAFSNIDPERKKIIDEVVTRVESRVESRIKLEAEAADYAISVSNLAADAYTDFIEGANSKWVQAERIKAQIEIIRSVGDKGNGPNIYGNLKVVLMKLNQQLKQLEDENT